MTITVKNDKGLFAGHTGLAVHREVLLPIIHEALARKDEAALGWINSLLALGATALRTGGHGSSNETLTDNTAAGWVAADARMTKSNDADPDHWNKGFLFLNIPNMPSGFGNETVQWAQSAQGLRAHWEAFEALTQSASADLAGLRVDEAAKARENALMAALPKKTALAKMKSLAINELEEGWEAKGGEAWAIWMGSARELGYMDDKKRPAGAASARLFESSAAALRTAKAAKFGSDRGPASIVRLRVECVEIVSSEQGASCSAVRQQMARQESLEIAESMEEASLDQIRAALGEPTASPKPTLAAPEEGSLAGRENGYACWVDAGVSLGYGRQGASGFVNIRGVLGPLTGAVLKATTSAAEHNHGYWGGQTSVVKISCWPVGIDETIGEPNVANLRAAIEWEQAQAAEAALKKQDSDKLRARAEELSSGQAAPRRRARSL